MNGLKVLPTAYDWLVDGKSETYRAAERQEDVRLQTIDFTKNLRIDISAPARPSQAIVTLFRNHEIDEYGIPRNNIGTEVDCLKTLPIDCSVAPEDGGFRIQLDIDADVRLVVIHLGYLSLTDVDGETRGQLLTGSWALRLSDSGHGLDNN